MNTRLPFAGTLVAAALALAGCASNVPLEDKAPVESRTGAAGGAGGATPQSRVAPVDTGSAQNAALAAGLQRIVYFDFDSFVVKEEFRPVVEGHARLLSGDKALRMTIEGHTDERGGREYNLALGQKRAEAVARSLALLGVTAAQVEPVSFGEERPAVSGSDEASWAKNRRAELVRK